jgi:hypothetical protein
MISQDPQINSYNTLLRVSTEGNFSFDPSLGLSGAN